MLFFPYQFIFNCMLRNNYEVCTFDLSGHGSHSHSLFTVEDLFNSYNKMIEHFHFDRILDVKKYLFAHSFGGAIALKYLTSSLEFKEAAIVATPVQFPLHIFNILRELAFVFSYDFIEHSKNYGFYEMLPSAGPFKRKEYPIRTRKEDPYYLFVVKI